MRIILLAFFLTFTWAVLANEENIDYKVINVKTHSSIDRILVLDIMSDEFGTENVWIYFNGTDHNLSAIELFKEKEIRFVRFIERDNRTVFNSDEVRIYTHSKKNIGILDRLLPRKSIRDRFIDIWNEGFIFVN